LTVAVKYAIDNENSRFLMSGSSALGLLDSAADSLAGRIQTLSLPTCCWGEDDGTPDHSIFTEKLNPVEIRNAQRKLREAVAYGQFPEVINQKDAEQKRALLKNYRNTYFIRDMMQLANIENADGLMAIFLHIARSIGSHLEISNFAKESGLSFPTAKKYINALSSSQLIFKLRGYQYGPAKRYIKASKIYFADNGIIDSMNVKLSDGQIIENFVLSEIEKRRKLGLIDAEDLYYYKSAGGREIDCVFESGDSIHAVEIKASPVVTNRDVNNLIDFKSTNKRNTKMFLFYLGTRYEKQNGVHIIPIASFYRGY
jgi:predicted AAA+ superfamily ATPase